MTQLTAQAIGSASVTLATLAAAFVLMYAVKATGTLRVSKAGELEGLDVHEHGMLAYPEFSTHPIANAQSPPVGRDGDGANRRAGQARHLAANVKSRSRFTAASAP